MALEAKEDQRRNERESFLITAIPINIQAAHESSMHHGSSDPEYEEGQLRVNSLNLIDFISFLSYFIQVLKSMNMKIHYVSLTIRFSL